MSHIPLPVLRGELSTLCAQTAVVEGLPVGAGKTRFDGDQVFFDVEVCGVLTGAEPRLLVFDERVSVRHLLPSTIDLSPLLGHQVVWRSTQGAGASHGFEATLSVAGVTVLFVSDRAASAPPFPLGDGDLVVFESPEKRLLALRARSVHAEAS